MEKELAVDQSFDNVEADGNMLTYKQEQRTEPIQLGCFEKGKIVNTE